jgi:hypothetical protein
MKIKIAVIGMIFTVVVPLTYADSFEQYVVPVYSGPSAKPDFQSLPGSRDYRTRIRNGIKQGVNFAGHYAIVMFGCGMGCQMGFLADVRSGKIFGLPFGGEEQEYLLTDFRPYSKLIKVGWTEEGYFDKDMNFVRYDRPICVSQELVLKGTAFQVLRTAKTAGDCDRFGVTCCPETDN